MARVRQILLMLLAGAGLWVGAASASGSPKASKSQQTHPRVRPRVGGRRTTFTLSFTLRQTPGHSGVMQTDYRVEISPRQRSPAACSPSQPAPITSGTAGEVVRLALAPPSHGWCARTYRVTVFLERGPYCPPPHSGGSPTPCPEFATQELDVGRARFRVVDCSWPRRGCTARACCKRRASDRAR